MSFSRPDLKQADESDGERADLEAADWATRLNARSLTSQEKNELAAWKEREAGNASRLETYRQLYAQLGDTVPRMVDTGKIADFSPARRPARSSFTFWPRLVGGLAVAAVLAVGGVWWHQRPDTFTTIVGRRQSIALADGSHVDLNARTTLEAKMHGSDRHIKMDQGEAYFDVAKDPARPFYVETPAGTVRVLGTHFNVRTVDAGQLEVTVIEGSVAVTMLGQISGGRTGPLGAPEMPDSGGPAQKLARGDQLSVVGPKLTTLHLSGDAANDVIAWREGRMVFESERLDVAVARFARYHGREISVAPEIAGLEIGGRFKLDELDTFLNNIALALPVQILRYGDGPIRVVPRK